MGTGELNLIGWPEAQVDYLAWTPTVTLWENWGRFITEWIVHDFCSYVEGSREEEVKR